MPISYTATTFADLTKHVTAFMKPHGLRLLFVVGDPGGSKSHTIKTQLKKGEHEYLKTGRLTAFQFYKLLYRHRDKALILDDVEDALKRDDTRKLLMQACETDDDARQVGWLGTESRLVVKRGKKSVRIPQEFKCTSRVCIVCNDWEILSGKFGPLLDRGIVVFFDPPNEEIHRYVAGWFKDKEILDFIGGKLDAIKPHSVRYYVNAKEMKKHDLDWKAALTESWAAEQPEASAEAIFEEIIANPKLTTDIERVAEFERRTGRKRRTYFNYKRTHRTKVVPSPLTTDAEPGAPGSSNERRAEATDRVERPDAPNPAGQTNPVPADLPLIA